MYWINQTISNNHTLTILISISLIKLNLWSDILFLNKYYLWNIQYIVLIEIHDIRMIFKIYFNIKTTCNVLNLKLYKLQNGYTFLVINLGLLKFEKVYIILRYRVFQKSFVVIKTFTISISVAAKQLKNTKLSCYPTSCFLNNFLYYIILYYNYI